MKWYVMQGVPPLTRNGWEVTNRYGTKESYWFETEEWAQQCANTFNRLETAAFPPSILTTATINSGNFTIAHSNITFTIPQRENSNWTCYLFGSKPPHSGFMYTPRKGEVPNFFVRWMMKICFDCTWVKTK
jgi:hypothetical protein